MSPLPAEPSPRFALKADSYEAHAQVQADAANWLAQWLPQNNRNIQVLELGAGTGLYTRHLAQHYDKLTSTDLAPEMLRICQQQIPHPAYQIQNAWEPLPNPGLWDLLTACSLLQWAPDPVEVLARWSKALAPQGRIITAFFIAPTLKEMEAVTGHPGPVHWRDATTWQSIFQAAGLQTLRLEEQTRQYSFSSAMHFWKTLHGTGATVSRQLKPASLLRFFRQYEERFNHPQGVYSTWTFCRVELSKTE